MASLNHGERKKKSASQVTLTSGLVVFVSLFHMQNDRRIHMRKKRGLHNAYFTEIL